MLDRRELIKRAGIAALATGFGSVKAFAQDTVTLPFDNGERPLVKYPQKRPMIGLTQPAAAAGDAVLRSSTTARSRPTMPSSCAIIWPGFRSISIRTNSRSRSRARSTIR